MIKNTAGQSIGVQMINASDGTAFTGSVTVSVTGDAGTQATGSVGSGACTHEGNGYHTYTPSQAETNYSLIAFTFTGTGAVPQTVQVYTITGDAYARLGAPAGASVSADVAAIKSDSGAIKTTTDKFVFTTANKVDARAFTVDDKTGYAIGNGGIAAAAFAANSITASALHADAVDEILDEAIGDSTITMRQALRVMLAALGGKVSGAGTTTITFRNAADSADVIVATVDTSGNRSAVTLTP